MSGVDGSPATTVGCGHPDHELLRVDPRLLEVVASLFWATFPHRRLGRGAPDGDGRVPLATDGPWPPSEQERWRAALDQLLRQPFARDGGAVLREVQDGAGRRAELMLPVAPDAYRGGSWLVGPFASPAAVDAWARTALRRPWVHDLHPAGETWFADVFVGDPGYGGEGAG